MATFSEWNFHFMQSRPGRLQEVVVLPVLATSQWQALRQGMRAWRRFYPGWSWVGFSRQGGRYEYV